MNNASAQRIAVLGAGAWGTALASVCARNGHATVLWGRDTSQLAQMKATRRNEAYLPGIGLPSSLELTGDLEEAVSAATHVLLVTPAQTIGDMARRMAGLVPENAPVVLCAKGINRETGELPAEIAARHLGTNPLAVLSGPSFASDVANGLPTAVTLAANSIDLATRLSETLSGPTLRLYSSDDLKGVELGGALKNVIALAVGVCRGMGLGASAEAALIARGFAELNRLAIALDAKPATLMGLSGLGDLVLTCSSPQSRNFAYGMELGRVDTVAALPGGLKLAEGALTAPIAAKLAAGKNIDAPIVSSVAELVEGTITARAALATLLARPLKKEGE